MITLERIAKIKVRYGMHDEMGEVIEDLEKMIEINNIFAFYMEAFFLCFKEGVVPTVPKQATETLAASKKIYAKRVGVNLK